MPLLRMFARHHILLYVASLLMKIVVVGMGYYHGMVKHISTCSFHAGLCPDETAVYLGESSGDSAVGGIPRPDSGPPPMGNRAINHRIILASWEAHQSYDNTEMILRRQRFRVPA